MRRKTPELNNGSGMPWKIQPKKVTVLYAKPKFIRVSSQAHADRGWETEPNEGDLRVISDRRRAWSTRRKRVRSEREAIAPGTESPVLRWPRARKPVRDRRSTPTAPEDEDRRRLIDDTVYRVSVNGVERPRSRLCRRSSFDSGNGDRFAGH
jgi:hypothetical protein